MTVQSSQQHSSALLFFIGDIDADDCRQMGDLNDSIYQEYAYGLEHKTEAPHICQCYVTSTCNFHIPQWLHGCMNTNPADLHPL